MVLPNTAAGIKIQLFKTKLFQSEVEYLSHRISKDRVSMILEYRQRIKYWPQPKTGSIISPSYLSIEH